MSRRIMMKVQGGGGLPPEYQQVEWIANNEAYRVIPTGLTTIGLRVEFGIIAKSGGISHILCCTKYGFNTLMLGVNPTGSLGFWGNGDSLGTISLDQRYDIVLSAGYQSVNDTEYSYADAGSDLEWGIGGSLTQQYWNNSQWLYCRMYKDGVLERDFVPCYRKSDEQVGFWDLVTEDFFTCARGNWDKGSDVN